MSEIKTRFAPSPTGYLHIGGARTALFNWLFARHSGGKFVLRIEDTDLERSTKESVDTILEGMEWLGLDWDEGPLFQSKRTGIYLEHINRMLDEGKAYRCYCQPEELDEKRNKAMSEGRKPKYDGKCRDIKEAVEEKPYTIRFRGPETGETVVNDMIKGRVTFDNGELDDLIIARSDGSPTYNFVVVVDDATMGITHILRGDDHLNNTPRQILLYEAMGYDTPIFGHLPLILGEDKKRLSKRHGATSVTAYRDMGYLPHALVNYLARLGWSHGDQEIFSIEELTSLFDTKNIGKSAGIFNAEKLLWLNAHYIKEASADELGTLLTPLLQERGLDLSSGPAVESVIPGLQERANTMVEMADMAEFYYLDDVAIDEKAAAKFLNDEGKDILNALVAALESLDDFTEEGVGNVIKGLADGKGIKMGKVGQPARVAITGKTSSPGMFEVIAILGKEKTVARLKKALNNI